MWHYMPRANMAMVCDVVNTWPSQGPTAMALATLTSLSDQFFPKKHYSLNRRFPPFERRLCETNYRSQNIQY